MSFPIDSQDEMGRLGVLHLERLWARVTRRSPNKHSDDWLFDRVVIDGLGLLRKKLCNTSAPVQRRTKSSNLVD